MKNNWRAAGVAIYKGYASLWLGEGKDPVNQNTSLFH